MPRRGLVSNPPIECVTGFGKLMEALRSRRTIAAVIFSAPLIRGARRHKQSIVQALPRIRGAAPGCYVDVKGPFHVFQLCRHASPCLWSRLAACNGRVVLRPISINRHRRISLPVSMD